MGSWGHPFMGEPNPHTLHHCIYDASYGSALPYDDGHVMKDHLHDMSK